VIPNYLEKQDQNNMEELNLHPGDIVKVPFSSYGVVRKVKNIPWGHKYIVEILLENPFYKYKEKQDFKREQLEKVYVL